MHDQAKLMEAASLIQTVPDKQVAHEMIARATREMLLAIGEDPDREGLLKTPERVARAYDELMAGYSMEPLAVINNACFDAEYNEMVVVKDIDFFSMCEHHVLPFFGRVDIAYIPNGKVLGLSKIPRVVEMFSRRLQLQERMTQEIANFLDELLHPEGVAVMVSGQHLCSMMRGVRKVNARMVTQAMLGKFEDKEFRDQFFDRIRDYDR